MSEDSDPTCPECGAAPSGKHSPTCIFEQVRRMTPEPLDVNGLPPGVGSLICDAVMELRREGVLDPHDMREASAVLIGLAKRILARKVGT
jgi:hypothetical protein